MRYRTDRPEPRAHASCVRLQQLPGDFMSSTPFLREKGASDLSTAYSFMPHKQCPMADVLAGKVSGIYDAEVHIKHTGSIACCRHREYRTVGGRQRGHSWEHRTVFTENPLRKRTKARR